ncbi:hypothetical protein D3C75_1352160 [compost metagenome]
MIHQVGGGHCSVVPEGQEHIFLLQIAMIQIEHRQHKTKRLYMLLVSSLYLADHEIYHRQTSLSLDNFTI